jgi:hypothetical protein
MASIALAENVHPKVVQERLGHSRIDTTLDVYSHALPEFQREVAGILDSAVLNASADDSSDDNTAGFTRTEVDGGAA